MRCFPKFTRNPETFPLDFGNRGSDIVSALLTKIQRFFTGMKLVGRQDLDLGLRRKKEKYASLTSLLHKLQLSVTFCTTGEHRQGADRNERTVAPLYPFYGADTTEAPNQKSTTIIKTW